MPAAKDRRAPAPRPRTTRLAASRQARAKAEAQAASSLVNPTVFKKLVKPGDKKAVKLRFNAKVLTALSEPGNWQESTSTKPALLVPHGFPRTDDAPFALPLVNSVEEPISGSFPSGRPFNDKADMIQCKHCKKPVFRRAAPAHIRDCLRKKQEKMQRKKEAKEAKDAALRKERNGGMTPEPPNKKGGGQAKKAGKDEEVAPKKQGKKRKAEAEPKPPNPKKKKKEPVKPKANKQKGPVDVEKQCGVILANGQMCARSLTCKSHSMGAKRAVMGRSMPYDVLLAHYQKRNQAKQHKAAMDANAPPPDDFEVDGDLDSEKETEAVMDAISKYCHEDPLTGGITMGEPLFVWEPKPILAYYNHNRIKRDLHVAMKKSKKGRIFGYTPEPSSGSEASDEDKDDGNGDGDNDGDGDGGTPVDSIEKDSKPGSPKGSSPKMVSSQAARAKANSPKATSPKPSSPKAVDKAGKSQAGLSSEPAPSSGKK